MTDDASRTLCWEDRREKDRIGLTGCQPVAEDRDPILMYSGRAGRHDAFLKVAQGSVGDTGAC